MDFLKNKIRGVLILIGVLVSFFLVALFADDFFLGAVAWNGMVGGAIGIYLLFRLHQQLDKQKHIIQSLRNEGQAAKQKALELSEIQAQNQALINAIPDIILRVNRSGMFIDCKSQENIFDMAPESLCGKCLQEFVSPEVAELGMKSIEKAIASRKLQVLEYEMPVRNQIQFFEARIVSIGKNEVVAIIRNVSDQKQLESKLTYLSLYDSMTGLYNRTYFEETMQGFEQSGTRGTGIIVCDVDGLKLINDTLGHSAGDEVLKLAASFLRQAFCSGEFIARIGGDEFAVIVNSAEHQSLETACARLQQNINEYNHTHKAIPLNLSSGFALAREYPLDMQALYQEADNQMYCEKLNQRQSVRNAIVEGMMSVLQERNIVTEEQEERLQNWLLLLANEIGLSGKSKAELCLLGRFHDVGNIGISDTLLLKPARLSDEERRIIQRHCELGQQVAAAVPELVPIADAVLKHHEWWNGEGYPLGIKEQDIPLLCRLIAIADAYESMTHERPYRKALCQKEAVLQLKSCAGYQFDPALTEAFIRCLKN